MPPIESPVPTFQVADLKRATDCYLRHAYPNGSIPPAIQRRLNWPADVDAVGLLALPVFEKMSVRNNDTEWMYCLRLGNSHYPHMKLQIQSFRNRVGYMLSVNTHDQVSLPSDAVDYERFREIQRNNQSLKGQIESEWRHAGLPTFNAYLAEALGLDSDQNGNSATA